MAGDWKNITDERERYAAYLCSREWAKKKEAVHKRANGRCERCRVFPIDAVHHLTYVRKYDESLDDLQGSCKHCHAFTHGKKDFDPASSDPLTVYLRACVFKPFCGPPVSNEVMDGIFGGYLPMRVALAMAIRKQIEALWPLVSVIPEEPEDVEQCTLDPSQIMYGMLWELDKHVGFNMSDIPLVCDSYHPERYAELLKLFTPVMGV